MPGPEYLFAGLLVSDIDSATEWYTTFFGSPPAFRPNDIESVWQVVPTGSIYIKADPGEAGHGVLTIAVGDLNEEIASLAERGVTPGAIESVGTVGVESKLRDPDGNEITLVQIFS
jgi:predicted enzyme related to lactoylglutathione lyase